MYVFARVVLNLLDTVDFFFQAEDGIRGKLVTGVQTCALPISRYCEINHSRRIGLYSDSSVLLVLEK